MRRFLGKFGVDVPAEAGDATLRDFEAQCEALLEAAPPIVSSIMGLYQPAFVAPLKEAGIAWFATATTVAEALTAEAAGADVIVAQGMEAGGHRGAFDATRAERELVGTFALLPAIVDAVHGVMVDAPTHALGALDGSEWVYAHVPVDEGTHVMTGSAPFGLTVAGYDVEVSYGFAAGSGLEPISIPPRPPG